MGSRIHWSLQYIKDANALELSQDSGTPHIVVMGNSLNGSFSDYMNRFKGTCEHSGPCEDNRTHMKNSAVAGQSLKIFMWQHVVLESGSKVMSMLNNRTSIMPLTAAV